MKKNHPGKGGELTAHWAERQSDFMGKQDAKIVAKMSTPEFRTLLVARFDTTKPDPRQGGVDFGDSHLDFKSFPPRFTEKTHRTSCYRCLPHPIGPDPVLALVEVHLLLNLLSLLL